jgi:DNA-directed RNA polymerase subunit beta
MVKELQPLLTDASSRRDHIRDKTVSGLKDLFPIIGRRHTLEVKNVKVKKKDYSSNQQKEALMKGRTLHEPITGTLVMRDNEGQLVEEKKNHTLLHLPYFTERHTFIVGGNEYDIPSQMRLKPGVYTRERNNGEFEAAFNLSKGSNFRLSMEPESGRLHMELGTSKVPLYSLLRSLGVPDVDIRKHWGEELRDINASKFKGKEEVALNKVINKIKRRGDTVPTTVEGKKEFVRSYFENTAMDPEVNTRTLGVPVSQANPLALLTASEKLIRVQRGEDTEDDRDSLEFKTVHSVDDFFRERLTVDAKRTIARKVGLKMDRAKGRTLKEIVPNSTFTKSLNSFLTSSNLSSIPMQINPVEIIDHASRITSLGEGGISSERAIPFQARQVHNTHLGILDPVRTPETFKAGVDVRAGLAAYRDHRGNLYSLMKDIRTGKMTHVPATTLAKSTVAFSGQDHRSQMDAVRGTDVVSVKRSEVDYELPDPVYMFGPTTAMVPLLDGMQGNRAIMGAKMQTQALPLVEREAPYVQAAAARPGQSMEREVARLVVPTALVDGTVAKVDADYIYIRPDKVKTGSASEKTAAAPLQKIPYDTYFPLSSKTYLHNDVTVKAGDRVKADQALATSNFTKDSTMALGKNMSVGYMAYYGKNSNDAVVISSGAASKLTSEHMYKEVISKGKDIILGKDKYTAYYAMNFTAEQLGKLDDNGVAKKGATLHKGDPIILGLRKAPPSPEAALLGNFHKSLVKPYRDITVTWGKPVPAVVQDTMDSARQIMVTVRTKEPMKIGDKLANRFGGKGVVSEIIPDERMVQAENGKPIDVLFTSASVVSRINPGQIVEAAIGKVVEKTGKPVILPQFMRENNITYAKKLLKKHNIKDKETVYDPVADKKIDDIFVGNSYIHKLFKSTETNYAARGVSAYDINRQPTRGGEEGAKGLGKMELNALLAHNARNILKEALTVKSEKSDEYWRAYEFGFPAPPSKTPFVSEKFVAMLQGAGINVDKSGSQVTLGPLTDRDVKKMSSGPLSIPSLEKSKSFMVSAKDMKPEKGGLFDPALTGGLSGTRWAHMELAEPVVNPVFEEPVRRFLGMTKAQLRAEIGEVGGTGIRDRLNRLDLAKKKKELLELTKHKKGADLDNAIKQLKYLRALKKGDHKRAGTAYTLSRLAVVPPVMRPILPSQRGNELQVSDLNYLYRDVGLASEALRGISDLGLPGATADARHHLHDAAGALFGTMKPTSPQLKGREAKGFIEQITGTGSPKTGFMHKKILARRQDLSGRATATPDNTLDMDQIGIPEDMLWKTYSKFIMRGLVNQGYKPAMAADMIEERHPTGKLILDGEMQKRPIIVNRAPSLHKHNLVAAYPVSVPGKSLRVNPFMERGQNLDYDGDAMQLHVPISEKAVAEAQELTLSKLLFSDKNRDDLMVFPQHEAILGTYLATATKEPGKAKRFKNKAAAMAAYRKGHITMNTPVTIG